MDRIEQGEGLWNRPSKTALERSSLTEAFEVRESHTEAEMKKNSWPIPVLSKTQIVIVILVKLIALNRSETLVNPTPTALYRTIEG